MQIPTDAPLEQPAAPVDAHKYVLFFAACQRQLDGYCFFHGHSPYLHIVFPVEISDSARFRLALLDFLRTRRGGS